MQKTKKRFTKVFSLLVLSALALSMLLTSCGSNEVKVNNADVNMPKIGQVVKSGPFEYTVKSVTDAKELQAGKDKKTTDKNYVIVDVDVKNTSSKPEVIDLFMFTLIRQDGTNVKANLELNQPINVNENGDSLFAAIPANTTESLKIVFETDGNSTKEVLALQVAGGVASTETERISLKK